MLVAPSADFKSNCVCARSRERTGTRAGSKQTVERGDIFVDRSDRRVRTGLRRELAGGEER